MSGQLRAGALPRLWASGFTGNETPCLSLSLDKWRTKVLMQSAGPPHPAAILSQAGGESVENVTWPAKKRSSSKPVCADCQRGHFAASVIEENQRALHDAVRPHSPAIQVRRPLSRNTIERPELNVSVLQEGKHVRVARVAEIGLLGV